MHSLGQVNAKDRLGWSLLMLAVVNGHVDCTKLLLKLNADVEAEASSPTEHRSRVAPGRLPVPALQRAELMPTSAY